LTSTTISFKYLRRMTLKYYLRTTPTGRFLNITDGKRVLIDVKLLSYNVSFLICFFSSTAFCRLFVVPIVSEYSVEVHSGLADHHKLHVARPFPQLCLWPTSSHFTSLVFVDDPSNLNQLSKTSSPIGKLHSL